MLPERHEAFVGLTVAPSLERVAIFYNPIASPSLVAPETGMDWFWRDLENQRVHSGSSRREEQAGIVPPAARARALLAELGETSRPGS